MADFGELTDKLHYIIDETVQKLIWSSSTPYLQQITMNSDSGKNTYELHAQCLYRKPAVFGLLRSSYMSSLYLSCLGSFLSDKFCIQFSL